MTNRSVDSLNQWLTLQEAARLLGVHQNTLRRWADAGYVHVHRTPGGHRRFERAQIERLWLEHLGASNGCKDLPNSSSPSSERANVLERLFVIGFDHKATHRPIRERIAAAELGPLDVYSVLSAASTQPGGTCAAPQSPPIGAVVLNTCHRTEIYGSSPAPHAVLTALLTWLQTIACIDAAEMRRNVRFLQGRAAARHLYEVAAGLHSVVRGEAQILGQVKQAFQQALHAGTTNAPLATLFRMAVEVGKKMRTQALVGVVRTSVADMAIDRLIAENRLQMASPPVVVGSGQMASLVIARLYALGCNHVIVVSRDPQAAQRLHVSDHMAIHTAPPGQLVSLLGEAQLVFFCNRSPRPAIGTTDLHQAVQRSRHRSLTLVDLAHPPAIVADALPDSVRLINLAELERADTAATEANVQMQQATALIDQQLAAFEIWCRERTVSAHIADVNGRIGQIAAEELQRALAKLPVGDEHHRTLLEELARRIAGRSAHAAITALKTLARSNEAKGE